MSMYTEVPKGWASAFDAYKQSMSAVAPKTINAYFNAYYQKADSDARYTMRKLKTTEKRYEFLTHNLGAIGKMRTSVDARINFLVRQDLRRKLKTTWFEGFIDRAESILRKGTTNDELRNQAMEVMWHLEPNRDTTRSAIGETQRELSARQIYIPNAKKLEEQIVGILKMDRANRAQSINRIMRVLRDSAAKMGIKGSRVDLNLLNFQRGLESLILRPAVTVIRFATFLSELSQTQTWQAAVNAGNNFVTRANNVFINSKSVTFVNSMVALCWPLVLASLVLNQASGNIRTVQGIGRTAGNIAYTFGLFPLSAARGPDATATAILPLVYTARGARDFLMGFMRGEATAARSVLPALVNVTAEAVAGANGGLTAAERAAAVNHVARSTNREIAARLVAGAAAKKTLARALFGVGDLLIGATTLYAGVEDAKAGHVTRATANIVAGSLTIVAGIFALALLGATSPAWAASIAGMGAVFTALSMGAAVAATFVNLKK